MTGEVFGILLALFILFIPLFLISRIIYMFYRYFKYGEKIKVTGSYLTQDDLLFNPEFNQMSCNIFYTKDIE